MNADGRGRLSVAQAVSLMVAAFVLMSAMLHFGAALRGAVHGLDHAEGLRRVTGEPLGPALAELVAVGLVTWAGARLAHGSLPLREALTARAVPVDVALLALLAGMAMHLPLVELSVQLSTLFPGLGRDAEAARHVAALTRIDSPWRAFSVPFSVIAVAAGAEETLFRGLFLPALRPRFGTIGAVVLSAALFGAFHLDPAVALVASVAGLILGALAVRTRSMLPGIAFHGGFNAVPLLLPPTLVSLPALTGTPGAHVPGRLVATTLALAALSLWRLALRTGTR